MFECNSPRCFTITRPVVRGEYCSPKKFHNPSSSTSSLLAWHIGLEEKTKKVLSSVGLQYQIICIFFRIWQRFQFLLAWHDIILLALVITPFLLLEPSSLTKWTMLIVHDWNLLTFSDLVRTLWCLWIEKLKNQRQEETLYGNKFHWSTRPCCVCFFLLFAQWT